MRTNIELDKDLVDRLMTSTGTKTKRQLVHAALLNYEREVGRQELLKLRGQIEWHGDLDALRRGAVGHEGPQPDSTTTER